MTRTAVYRHYDADGRLLYIGCSCDPFSRFAVHRSVSSWAHDVANMSVEWFPDRETALCAEKAAILTEKPPHNSGWKQKEKRHWPANIGHLLVRDWAILTGTGAHGLAARLGVGVEKARALMLEVKHIQIPMQINICIATDGAIPTTAWSRRHSGLVGNNAPRLKLATGDRAKGYLKDALSTAKVRKRELIPYATELLRKDAA